MALGIAIALTISANGFPFPAGQSAGSSTVLAAMARMGDLQYAAGLAPAAGSAYLESVVAEAVPSELGANITITTYYYETGASCQASCQLAGSTPAGRFCTCSVLSANTSSSLNATWLSSARRMFYIPSSDRFGMATLEVWPR